MLRGAALRKPAAGHRLLVPAALRRRARSLPAAAVPYPHRARGAGEVPGRVRILLPDPVRPGAADLERGARARTGHVRSEEHTSELQSLMRSSYAVFC